MIFKNVDKIIPDSFFKVKIVNINDFNERFETFLKVTKRGLLIFPHREFLGTLFQRGLLNKNWHRKEEEYYV